MQHLNVLHTGALGEEGRRDMALVCRLYRALNDSTVKNKFPIPIVEELLDELCGAKFYTKHDLRYSYHQVRMHLANTKKTTFRTHNDLYEFLVMLFGLTNNIPGVDERHAEAFPPLVRAGFLRQHTSFHLILGRAPAPPPLGSIGDARQPALSEALQVFISRALCRLPGTCCLRQRRHHGCQQGASYHHRLATPTLGSCSAWIHGPCQVLSPLHQGIWDDYGAPREPPQA